MLFMIKKLHLIIFFALSVTSSYAQIRTGGVAMLPEDSAPYNANGIIKLEEYLVKKDAHCSINKKIRKGQKLFDIYLILSLHKANKSTFEPTEQCRDINEYLACLNDPATVGMVTKYVKSPWFKSQLMTNHNLTDSEAEKVVNFFIEMPQKK